jgi:serine protease Do
MYQQIFHDADASRAARSRGVRGKVVTAVAAFGMGAVLFSSPFAMARQTPENLADLAEKVTPAVVNISTTQSVERGTQRLPQQSPFPPGSQFEEFFKRFFDQQNFEQGQSRSSKATALGSGFIIDASGYVVTNDHVVGKADKIDVTLTDGRKFDAKLIGRDEKTDLALLKIDAEKPLPFVTFGDSDKARVGDPVMAVGNPFGLGGTVTSGIISARHREIQAGPYDNFLQIDAAINRGNSGGPSFNMAGEVIGVNSAIYSPTGGSVGIGFAIPSSTAKPVIAALRENGKVERGWLGVQIQEVTPEIASGLGLDGAKGALVAAITPDSPAAKAGLKQGDVILSVDGQDIERLRDLTFHVAGRKAGDKLTMSVWRDGANREVQASVASMPKEQVAKAGEQPSTHEKTGALGLGLAPLNPETRQRFGLDEDTKGVVIANVRPDSPAAEAGLRQGDVVVSVNQTAITAPRQVSEQVAKARKDGRPTVVVLIARGGAQQFVALPIGKA